MSELLAALLISRAFDARPQGEEFTDFHVEFDDMFGGTAVEGELKRAISLLERTAIIGPSGGGKTSVADYVLASLDDTDLAPIVITVAMDAHEVVEDPRRFMQHLVNVISRQAKAANQLSEKERTELLKGATGTQELPARAVQIGGKGGVDVWVAHGELARDVTTTVSGGSIDRPAGEIQDQLTQVMEVIRSHELSPVLIFDDSDAFTRTAGGQDRTPFVAGFFGPALGTVVGLGIGIVAMVHDSYLELDAYQRLEVEIFEARVPLPRFDDPPMLGRLFERRIESVGLGAAPGDVFTNDALIELLNLYGGEKVQGNLRATVTIAQRALSDSVGAGHEQITAEAIATAASAEGAVAGSGS